MLANVGECCGMSLKIALRLMAFDIKSLPTERINRSGGEYVGARRLLTNFALANESIVLWRGVSPARAGFDRFI